MDEKFIHKIKDVLNDPPSIPFDEKAWKNLDRRLSGNPSKKWGAMAYLIPFAFLLWLLPFVFSWFTFEKLDSANDKIEHLESMLHSNSKLLLDSVVQRHVTVVFDTIYRTFYKDVKMEEKKSSQPPLQFYQPSFYENKITFLREQNYSHLLPPNSFLGLSSMPLSRMNRALIDLENKNIATDKLANRESLSSLQQLTLKPLIYSNDPELSVRSTPYQFKGKNKNLRYYLYKMQPTHFALGTGIGMVSVFGINNSILSSLSMNIDAAIGYGENLNLTISGEYLRWKFEKEFEDEDDQQEIYEDYPEAPPNSPEDKLHELYGDFKYIQIPIGLEYTLFSNKRLRPYFGFGVTAQRALRSQLIYEFKPASGEYKITKDNLLPNSFELKSAWGSLGIQYELGDHWRIRLGGSAQFDLEKGAYKYENLQLLKIKGGLKYKF